MSNPTDRFSCGIPDGWHIRAQQIVRDAQHHDLASGHGEGELGHPEGMSAKSTQNVTEHAFLSLV